MKKIIISENELKQIIKSAIGTTLNKNVNFITESGYFGQYIFENINEGLITSYDVGKCENFLKNKFQNIKNVRSMRFNPYKPGSYTKKQDFVAIDLKNYSNYNEIIECVKNLLGWFASEIIVKIPAKGGYKEYKFYCFKNTIECPELGEENDFSEFLQNNKIIGFTIVFEAKYGEKINVKTGEIYYHATDYSSLKKILKQGIVPKSKGNFPERIYLGKDVYEIKKMIGQNYNELVFLKIDVSGLNLYRDERDNTACYTYDNISPKRIKEIFEI